MKPWCTIVTFDMRYSTSYAAQASRCGNTFAFTTANFNLVKITIAVLENVPAEAGLQKRANFFTLIVGLAGTGDQTRATCVAGSGVTAQPSTTTALRAREKYPSNGLFASNFAQLAENCSLMRLKFPKTSILCVSSLSSYYSLFRKRYLRGSWYTSLLRFQLHNAYIALGRLSFYGC
jgi:hypothetical protein